MKKIIILATVSFAIVACGSKQPSEVDKADVSRKIIQCFSAVTTKIGQEPESIFSEMASFSASLSELTPEKMKKEWELLENGNIILTVDNGETKYRCEYAKNNDNTWRILIVHRNSEKVFDRMEDESNRNKNRIAYTSKWYEKGYSNVSYKYYEKHDEDADQESEGIVGRPTLRIDCDPKGARFQFNEAAWNSEKVVKVSFDSATAEEYQLTSSGNIGKKIKDSFRDYVVDDAQKDAMFRSKLAKSKSVKIDDYLFKVGNISSVPCL